MRKHMYLIVDHPDDGLVGQIEVTDRARPQAEVNSVGRVDKRNLESGDGYAMKVVGLGYHDFEGEADMEDRFKEVLDEKLARIDDEYLDQAGLDPQEVAA